MRFIDADALTYHKHLEVINGRKVYFDIVHKSEIDDAPTGIVFLCDGKACSGDCEDCKHTADIAHARNFYKTVAGWVELNESTAEEQETHEYAPERMTITSTEVIKALKEIREKPELRRGIYSAALAMAISELRKK